MGALLRDWRHILRFETRNGQGYVLENTRLSVSSSCSGMGSDLWLASYLRPEADLLARFRGIALRFQFTLCLARSSHIS
jgi:hypothetical protein